MSVVTLSPRGPRPPARSANQSRTTPGPCPPAFVDTPTPPGGSPGQRGTLLLLLLLFWGGAVKTSKTRFVDLQIGPFSQDG